MGMLYAFQRWWRLGIAKLIYREAWTRIKDQWANANDVYDDVHELITAEDPQIGYLELPEAVERRSAETISLGGIFPPP